MLRTLIKENDFDIYDRQTDANCKNKRIFNLYLSEKFMLILHEINGHKAYFMWIFWVKICTTCICRNCYVAFTLQSTDILLFQ